MKYVMLMKDVVTNSKVEASPQFFLYNKYLDTDLNDIYTII